MEDSAAGPLWATGAPAFFFAGDCAGREARVLEGLFSSLGGSSLAGSLAGGGSGAADGADAAGGNSPRRAACSLSMRALVGTTMGEPTPVPFNCAPISLVNCLRASAPARMRSTMPEVIDSSSRRAAARRDSKSWARSCIAARCRKPAPPLNVWKARKIELIVSASLGLPSRTMSPSSMLCSNSTDSPWNSRRSSPSPCKFKVMDFSSPLSATWPVSASAGVLAAACLAVAASPHSLGTVGIASPCCQASMTCIIQGCHELMLAMVSSENFAEPSKVRSIHWRATPRPAVS